VSLAAGLPVLLLCAEFLLRALDVAPEARFFVESEEGRFRACERSPWGNAAEIFNHESFGAHKAGMRIFCVGASTVRGFPFDPNVCFPRWLELRLKALFPDLSIEVITCAGNGRNAAAIADLVEELVEYQPDAILLYSGHNEMHAWNRGRLENPGRFRVQRFLGRSTLVSWIWRLAGVEPGSWSRELRDPAGEAADSPAGNLFHEPAERTRPEIWERAFALYEESLERMARATRSHEVALVMSTLASNLADYPPARSVLDLSTAEGREAWQRFESFSAAMKANAPPEARGWEVEHWERDWLVAAGAATMVDELEKAVDRSPQTAVFHYFLGRAQLSTGDRDGAFLSFRNARDLDEFPVRAVSRFSDIVRTVAGRHGLECVEPESLFEDRANGNPPGRESFVDNVHPNFAGQRLLARSFLEALQRLGIPRASNSWNFALEPDEATYERSMALKERAPRIAAKLADVGMRSLHGLAPHGIRLRPSVRTAFQLALELDPQSAEAQLGKAVLELVAGDADSAATLEQIVDHRPDLLPQLARIAAAHSDWCKLLSPVLSGR